MKDHGRHRSASTTYSLEIMEVELLWRRPNAPSVALRGDLRLLRLAEFVRYNRAAIGGPSKRQPMNSFLSSCLGSTCYARPVCMYWQAIKAAANELTRIKLPRLNLATLKLPNLSSWCIRIWEEKINTPLPEYSTSMLEIVSYYSSKVQLCYTREPIWWSKEEMSTDACHRIIVVIFIGVSL